MVWLYDNFLYFHIDNQLCQIVVKLARVVQGRDATGIAMTQHGLTLLSEFGERNGRPHRCNLSIKASQYQ